MPKNSVIGIIMATLLEAKPFIKALSLKLCIREPFEFYCNDHIRLVISGIGKANAAMASVWLIMTEHPTIILNLGAAGATDMSCSMGEIFYISKVIEPDRMIFEEHDNIPDILQIDIPLLRGVRGVLLATQDKPITSQEDREKISNLAALLTDMEGASVVQACKRLKTPCYLFKFVSDTPKDHNIIENIRLYRDAFCKSLLPIITELG